MSVTLKAPLEVGICVADLERAAAFYENVLGFKRISEATLAADRAAQAGFGPVSFRMLRMQTNYGERIKLLKPEPLPAAAERGGILAREGISYLTFVVADLDAALQRLDRAGARSISGGPVQTRPGTRLAFFRDSEGNVLELVQYDDLKAYRPDIAH
jgi:catechol 2,3-dioxygenase-like lactoylglutathione lyase family enzyme